MWMVFKTIGLDRLMQEKNIELKGKWEPWDMPTFRNWAEELNPAKKN